MANDPVFVSNMQAMLTDPGQLEELKQKFGLTERRAPVANPIDSKIFKCWNTTNEFSDHGGNYRLIS